jgi:hypothetical protein
VNLIELQTALINFGLPLAYQQFPEAADARLPYLIFLDHIPGNPDSVESRGRDIKADNRNWLRVRRIRLELYTDAAPAAALEGVALAEALEDYLDGRGVVWDYEGKVRIETERMYMAAWSVTLMY